METRYCPRCREALHEARGPMMTVDMCTTCGGAYFDHGELSKLARKYEEEFGKLEALVEPAEVVADPSSERERLRCPGCADGMESYQYAACSGIWLNRCVRCKATWVDEGELAAIGQHLDGGHQLLNAGADRIAPLMGGTPSGHPNISDQTWRSVAAVAGVLHLDPLVRGEWAAGSSAAATGASRCVHTLGSRVRRGRSAAPGQRGR